MSKRNRSVPIPDEVAEMLSAMAQVQGISEAQLMVHILKGVLDNPLLRRYVKDGVFDTAAFRADRSRDRAKLNEWHRNHPEEVANLRCASRATRRRVSHP